MLRYVTTILLIYCCNIITAQMVIPDEKIITYQVQQKSLKEILIDLSEISGVSIAFQDEILPVDSIIDLTARRKPLGIVIDELINRTETKYKIIGNQIVIVKDPYSTAKDEITISGYLKDLKSGEPLINANVYLYDRTAGTITNEYGFYSFTIPKGVQRVYYSYLGYELGVEEFQLGKDTTVNFQLNPNFELNEVLIVDKKVATPLETTGSVTEIALDKLQSTVSLAGESDVIRMAQMLPGINTSADGVGGMSVRGGSVDQNLILLDGVPIYNPHHGLGVFSVFNSNVISSATLYKGGFPARFGSRLSSILDIRTREGNYEKFSGDITIGLLAAKGTIEGPIKKGASSFLVSFRITFLDPLIKDLTTLINEQNNKVGFSQYYFYDINAKVNFKLSPKTRLYMSYYNGKDDFINEVGSEQITVDTSATELIQRQWDWGNQMGVVRITQQLGKKAFLKLAGYYTNYNFGSFDHKRFEFKVNAEAPSVFYNAGVYNSSITDIGFNLGLDVLPNNKNTLRTGLNVITHRFEPGLYFANQGQMLVPDNELITQEIIENQLNEASIQGLEIQAYIEEELNIGKHSVINIGLHQAIIFADEKRFFLPQPRLAFNYNKNAFNFKASASFVSQYLHLMTNSGLGLPIDVWLPSTDILKPQKGWIVSLGGGITDEKGFEYGTELFYKALYDVIAFNEGASLLISEDNDWQELIPIGTGEAYGAEFYFNKSTGKTNWQINYTLSYSNRQFDVLNLGEPFRYRYDRRHNFKLAFIQKINKNAEFTLNWNYATGNPITLPTSTLISEDDSGNQFVQLVYPFRNNWELPDYHRLDLGFNFYTKYKWGRQKMSLGLYNAYNQKNPFYVDLFIDNQNPTDFELRGLTLFPVLPHFSYSLSF